MITDLRIVLQTTVYFVLFADTLSVSYVLCNYITEPLLLSLQVYVDNQLHKLQIRLVACNYRKQYNYMLFFYMQKIKFQNI